METIEGWGEMGAGGWSLREEGGDVDGGGLDG